MFNVAIFGTGRIGGGVAARAVSSGLIDNLILYDNNQDLLNAQRLDIQHMGIPFSISTNYNEIVKSDIILFTAGSPRNPDIKTRSDLLKKNLPVVDEFAALLHSYQGIVIVISNPVDILTWYLWKKTKINKNKIIGFGGELDSARFQYEASKYSILENQYVIGEHGEHQVPIFSRYPSETDLKIREKILKKLQSSSMEIIRGKGGTEYAPVWHIWRLLQAIMTNSHQRHICSSVLEGEYGLHNCSLGVPVIIGNSGIEYIESWNLDEWESEHMKNAGKFVSDICRGIFDA